MWLAKWVHKVGQAQNSYLDLHKTDFNFVLLFFLNTISVLDSSGKGISPHIAQHRHRQTNTVRDVELWNVGLIIIWPWEIIINLPFCLRVLQSLTNRKHTDRHEEIFCTWIYLFISGAYFNIWSLKISLKRPKVRNEQDKSRVNQDFSRTNKSRENPFWGWRAATQSICLINSPSSGCECVYLFVCSSVPPHYLIYQRWNSKNADLYFYQRSRVWVYLFIVACNKV